jgi:hypothetical protein
MNLRDAQHGFKFVGNETIKLVTAHVLDQGEPLYDMVRK